MRLDRRSEVRVDTEVDSQISAFEPAASASCEVIRLRNMRDAEHPLIEGDRVSLESGRHRQLHMIETDYSHSDHSASGPHVSLIAGSAPRVSERLRLAGLPDEALLQQAFGLNILGRVVHLPHAGISMGR